jgi:CheY-like chemotaxis protein
VLQKLSSFLRDCLESAAQSRAQADALEHDPARQRDFRFLEERWNKLARSEEFGERLERFLQQQRPLRKTALRRSEAAPSTYGGKRDRSDSVCGNRLVSIVEDDTDVRESLERFILSLGYACGAFGTAEEHLESGLLAETACLISDVGLPGMSGPDLQVRLIADGYRIPVVFVTGTVSDIRTRMLTAGAVGYLAKPLDPGALIECLETALANIPA